MQSRSFVPLVFFSSVFFFSLASPVFAGTTSTLRPIADGREDGASWTNTIGTACSGAVCALEVDESSGASCTTSDGDVSFIGSSALGANQTFNLDLSSVPDGSTITGASVTACYAWNNQQVENTFQTRWCANGACVSSGTNIPVATVYTEATQTYTGLSIAKAASTDFEIGVAYTGTKGKPLKVSQLYATLTYTPPPAPSSGGSGGGVSPTIVLFAGQAYPSSTVEVLKKSSINGAFRNLPDEVSTMDEDGRFFKSYTGFIGAEYLFTLKAYDVEGRGSGVSSFNVDLLSSNTLKVEDIFFPPTLGFERETVSRGEDVHIVGYAAKHSTVELEVGHMIVQETTSDERGSYHFVLGTGSLEPGRQSVRVRQVDAVGDPKNPRRSGFSPTRAFTVTNLLHTKSDFNSDDRVDVADWSIFLFRWGSADHALHSSVDLNADGKVDILDFSIFLQSISARA